LLDMLPLEMTDSTYPTEELKTKNRLARDGTDNIYARANKYRVKLAMDTDLFFNPSGIANQSSGFLKLRKWFIPCEALDPHEVF
jgi:hypothetical protein